jgi:hypothetical protein
MSVVATANVILFIALLIVCLPNVISVFSQHTEDVSGDRHRAILRSEPFESEQVITRLKQAGIEA